jgi:DNA-binding MarR family transcriptional regulator
MDNNALRTLQLLEEIEQNNMPSQRYLAKQLNVSLGLINSFIKRLAKKGYFKVTTIPKNRVAYILTPMGMAEKSKLTYAYIHHSYQYYKGARKKLQLLFQELDEAGVRRVAFYGMGHFAEIAYISLQEISIIMVATVDDNKSGQKFMGHTVTDPSHLQNLSFDRVIITAINSRKIIREKLIKQGIVSEKIVILD